MDTASDIFWIILVLGLIWLVILIAVFVNIVRRREMPLITKIFWIIVILSFPVLGLLIYLLIGRRRVVED
ncbi:MAG TPA: PLDc N-terminal domain-containing protein [Chitinophagaceae bacterium]